MSSNVPLNNDPRPAVLILGGLSTIARHLTAYLLECSSDSEGDGDDDKGGAATNGCGHGRELGVKDRLVKVSCCRNGARAGDFVREKGNTSGDDSYQTTGAISRENDKGAQDWWLGCPSTDLPTVPVLIPKSRWRRASTLRLGYLGKSCR